LQQNVFNNKPLRVLMITRYYKLSIGLANICSSVQDHRQKFDILNRFWMNKRELRNQQKGRLKASEEKALLKTKVLLKTRRSWSDDVIRSKFIRTISSEAEDH
jgi:hypothetical protein